MAFEAGRADIFAGNGHQSCRWSGFVDGMWVQRSRGFARSNHSRGLQCRTFVARRCQIAGVSCLAGAGGIASCALGFSPARSQPVQGTARVLVGFPAGGPSDVTARLLAEHIKGYASSAIVENRPGAGGRVVMDVLKNSAADGSVMVVTPAVAMALYPHVYKSLGYIRSRISPRLAPSHTTAMLVAIGPMVPAKVKTLAEFIAWCKSNPRQSSYGSPGAGSPLHFLGVMLGRAANFEYLHVPFQGTAPSVQSSARWSDRLRHLADRRLRPARQSRDAAGAGIHGRKAQPAAARCADHDRGRISGARIRRMVRCVCSGADSSATVETLSSAVRTALQTKEVLAGFANIRWMLPATRRPTLPARSRPTPIAGRRS